MRQRAIRTLAGEDLDWPLVVLPRGWQDVIETFNLQGYGLLLIAPDGKVLGADIHASEVEQLLETLWPDDE